MDAESAIDITEKYPVFSVPTFLFFKAGKLLDTLQGANPPALAQKITEHKDAVVKSAPAVASDVSAAMVARLEQLVSASHVMLFMKGTPAAPRCGFSRKTVAMLQQHNVQFGSFDILEDQEVCL